MLFVLTVRVGSYRCVRGRNGGLLVWDKHAEWTSVDKHLWPQIRIVTSAIKAIKKFSGVFFLLFIIKKEETVKKKKIKFHLLFN